MPAFLMIATVIGGIAFADNKGHVCIEEKGFKTCIEGAIENSTNNLKQADYNKNFND